MKKFLIPVLIAIVFGAAGYFIGQKIGYDNCEIAYKYRPIDEIKDELKQRENEDITEYLTGEAGIHTKDEGGLFNVKYVDYFSGELSNTAILATAKDIKIRIEFYSKTKAKLATQDIIIYDYVKSGETIKFKKKIDAPEGYENFEFSIVAANTY